MAVRRNKPRAVTNIEAFRDDMCTIFKTVNRYQANLYTGGEHYLSLLDLHLQLCNTTLAVTGESELPWVVRSRSPWLAQK